MFNSFRFIICVVMYILIIWGVSKLKVANKRRAYTIGGVVLIALFILSSFIPFENFFITFTSPESAYEYRNPGAKAQMVVQGQECDYVIGSENGSSLNMFVPKNDNGWKVGIGGESKTIAQSFDWNIIVYVDQYKSTNDFFITVYHFDGDAIQITDSCNSEFVSLEKEKSNGEFYTKYYAYVPDYDEEYWIKVNGEEIQIVDR